MFDFLTLQLLQVIDPRFNINGSGQCLCRKVPSMWWRLGWCRGNCDLQVKRIAWPISLIFGDFQNELIKSKSAFECLNSLIINWLVIHHMFCHIFHLYSSLLSTCFLYFWKECLAFRMASQRLDQPMEMQKKEEQYWRSLFFTWKLYIILNIVYYYTLL